MPIFFKNVSYDEKKLRKEDEKASFFGEGDKKGIITILRFRLGLNR